MLKFSYDELLRLLSLTFLGNPIWRYLLAVGVVFIVFTAIGLLKRKLVAISRRTNNAALGTISKFRLISIFFLALYAGFLALDLHPKVESAGRMVFVTVLVIQVLVVLGNSLAIVLAQTLLRGSHDKPSVQNAARNLGVVIKFVMWTVGTLFILSNMGLNVASLLAGLGIGGIAIALATQSVLGDTFSSFVLYFDHPFEVGEGISFGDVSGTVEEIGLRTTKIRAGGGDLVIVPNSDVAKARIVKPHDISSRRATVKLGVDYKVAPEMLQGIPDLLQSLIGEVADTRFERAHLVEMGAYSLNFETVFFVNSPDYKVYLDRVQQVNFSILRSFERKSITLAYPTQTIRVEENLSV